MALSTFLRKTQVKLEKYLSYVERFLKKKKIYKLIIFYGVLFKVKRLKKKLTGTENQLIFNHFVLSFKIGT